MTGLVGPNPAKSRTKFAGSLGSKSFCLVLSKQAHVYLAVEYLYVFLDFYSKLRHFGPLITLHFRAVRPSVASDNNDEN